MYYIIICLLLLGGGPLLAQAPGGIYHPSSAATYLENVGIHVTPNGANGDITVQGATYQFSLATLQSTEPGTVWGILHTFATQLLDPNSPAAQSLYATAYGIDVGIAYPISSGATATPKSMLDTKNGPLPETSHFIPPVESHAAFDSFR